MFEDFQAYLQKAKEEERKQQEEAAREEEAARQQDLRVAVKSTGSAGGRQTLQQKQWKLSYVGAVRMSEFLKKTTHKKVMENSLRTHRKVSWEMERYGVWRHTRGRVTQRTGDPRQVTQRTGDPRTGGPSNGS